MEIDRMVCNDFDNDTRRMEGGNSCSQFVKRF
jgi:hypothetical protein